jgi:hypothetical protein
MDNEVLVKRSSLNKNVLELFDGVPGLYKVSAFDRSLIASVIPDTRDTLILPIVLIQYHGQECIVEYLRREIAPPDRIRIRLSSLCGRGDVSFEPDLSDEHLEVWYDIKAMLWVAHVRAAKRLRQQ